VSHRAGVRVRRCTCRVARPRGLPPQREKPALIETSYQGVFDETLEAVSNILRPDSLRYIVVPHFVGDECGALNRFLGAAPNAAVPGSPRGVVTSGFRA
jgi:hypothetical protein